MATTRGEGPSLIKPLVITIQPWTCCNICIALITVYIHLIYKFGNYNYNYNPTPVDIVDNNNCIEDVETSITSSIIGEYENFLYGPSEKNHYHFVSVLPDGEGKYIWKTQCNQWLLTPLKNEKLTFIVGDKCPYFKQGYKTMKFKTDYKGNIIGAYGPGNEYFTKVEQHSAMKYNLKKVNGHNLLKSFDDVFDIVSSYSELTKNKGVSHKVSWSGTNLVLSRRGGIATKESFTPSNKPGAYLLRVGVIFKFSHNTDFVTFSTRSNGQRVFNQVSSAYGAIDDGGCPIRIILGGSYGGPRIEMKGNRVDIQQPEIDTWLKVDIIDNGDLVKLQFFDGHGHVYHVETHCDDDTHGRFVMYNRELEKNHLFVQQIEIEKEFHSIK